MSKKKLIYIMLAIVIANNYQSLHTMDIKEWLYEHRYVVIGTACAATILAGSYVGLPKSLKKKQIQPMQEPVAEAVINPKPATDENKILLLLPSDTITLDVIAEKLFEER